MNLVVKDKCVVLEKGEISFENILLRISEIIDPENEIISHYNIDGNTYYGTFEDISKLDLLKIDEIVLSVKSKEEFILELTRSIVEYLERAELEIPKVVEDLYAKTSSETWNKMVDLFESLQWLFRAEEVINQTKVKLYQTEKLQKFSQNIKNSLTEIEASIINKDELMIADLINYEILPNVTKIKEHLQNHVLGEI